jgi:hypothetical protein
MHDDSSWLPTCPGVSALYGDWPAVLVEVSAAPAVVAAIRWKRRAAVWRRGTGGGPATAGSTASSEGEMEGTSDTELPAASRCLGTCSCKSQFLSFFYYSIDECDTHVLK